MNTTINYSYNLSGESEKACRGRFIKNEKPQHWRVAVVAEGVEVAKDTGWREKAKD